MAQATTARERRGAGPDELPAEPSVPRLLRTCGFTYLGTFIGGYAVCAALTALVTAIASGSTFSIGAALTGALALWLAGNHVPLSIGGADLGVLPLALPLVLGWFTATAAGGMARRHGVHRPGTGALVVTAMAVGQAVVGTVIAACVGVARPVTALLCCAVLAGIAALFGVAKPAGITAAVRAKLGTLGVQGVRLGLGALALLLAAAALLLTVAVLVAVPTGSALFEAGAAGAGGGFGLLLLCVGYLPNALVATLALLTGPGFSIGDYSVTPLSFHGGSVPSVPLLAALPEQSAGWWPVLLLLPLASAVAVGWYSRSLHQEAMQRLRIVAVAGLVAAFGALVLAALAGGALGNGPMNPVLIPAGACALVVFGWVAVVGGVVTWFAAPNNRSGVPEEAKAPAAQEPEQGEPVESVGPETEGPPGS